jgi:hypothetical protein
VFLVKFNLKIQKQLFFWTLVQSKVDWVLLHRKMLETLYFKCFFTKKFEIFGKKRLFHFSQKKMKIVYLVGK